MALLAVITLMILPASTVMIVLCANVRVYLRSETTLDRLDRWYLSELAKRFDPSSFIFDVLSYFTWLKQGGTSAPDGTPVTG